MEPDEVGFFCITANVGSIFEEPEALQKTWIDELLRAINRQRPCFIAMHCQEVGGKKSAVCQDLVHSFVRHLYDRTELEQYSRCLTFLDEDFKTKEAYTALGSLYFVHERLRDVHIWNFKEHKFTELQEAKEIYAGSLNAVPEIEKVKFPLNCFPKQIWSRKGYSLTRWKIQGRELEFINIHLIHDQSNVKALQASPSKYAKYRRESLAYTLNRLGTKDGRHQLIFGDFNTRLDTKSFIEHFMKDASSYQVKRDGEKKPHSITYKDTRNQSEEMLHIEEKRFLVKDKGLFSERCVKDLLQFDKELKWTTNHLREMPISFLPSYPHSEDPTAPTIYSSTRCPAWCDRVLISNPLYEDICSHASDVRYDLLGSDKCMGDHKPVTLHFRVRPDDLSRSTTETTQPSST